MTLTIDLTAAEQARLDAAARRQGIAPETVLKGFVNGLPFPPDSPEQGQTTTAAEQARVARIHAAQGSLAHVGVTVEDLHRERRSDKQNEEQQAPGRLP